MSRVDCEHEDVRYFDDAHGAVACCGCGRLFGHLVDGVFTAFNPSPTGGVRAVTPQGLRG